MTETINSNDTRAGKIDLRIGAAPSDAPTDAPIDDITAGCGGNCWCLTKEPESISPGYEVTVLD